MGHRCRKEQTSKSTNIEKRTKGAKKEVAIAKSIALILLRAENMGLSRLNTQGLNASLGFLWQTFLMRESIIWEST